MRITIVEDNESVAAGIAFVLRDEGHAVDLIDDGLAAEEFLAQDAASDLVVLDVNLPGRSGLEVLKAMRSRKDTRPVLLLTARGDTADRVEGLDAGADDYLVKPFEMAELLARIRALSRRRTEDHGPRAMVGGLEWDPGARKLFSASGEIDLPRRELALFEALANAMGRTVTKSMILDQLYGVGSALDETVVEVYISRLRKRLKPHGVRIRVRRGLGYALEADTL